MVFGQTKRGVVSSGPTVCEDWRRDNCNFGSNCTDYHPDQTTQATVAAVLQPFGGGDCTLKLPSLYPKSKASGKLGEGLTSLSNGSWDGVSSETTRLWEKLPLEPVQFDTPTIPGATKDDDDRQLKKIESIFHHDRLQALDPSLVNPTTPLEARNNVLQVSAIGKQYQIDVKDFNIRIRDNQIRAKDHQMAELSSLADLQDSRLEVAYADNYHLRDLIARKDWEIAGLSDLIAYRNQCFTEQVQRTQQMDTSLKEQDTNICMLYYELKSKKEEILILQKQRIGDRILQWLQCWLGQPPLKSPAVTFSLMQMLGEVRNRIYRCALVSRRPIDFWPIVSYNSDTACDHVGIDHTTVLFQQLKEINVNLLPISRQVYDETVGILLYGCNRFRFSDRGGWSVLNGWLTHINQNCKLLTNVSVAYPDWASTELMSRGQPFAARHPQESEEMRTIVRRFGGAIVDSPAGPSTNSFLAFDRAHDMLRELPSLNSISFVLPHNVHILAPWTERAVKTLGPDGEISPFATAGGGRSDGECPTRSFIFIHRHYHMPRKSLNRDLDDDTIMGRNHLMAFCQLNGATVKTASYGRPEDRVSYIVNNGEDDYDMDIPDYVKKRAVGFGGVLRPLGAAKRLLGYK